MTIPSEGKNIPTFEQFHFYRLLKYGSKDIYKDIPSGIICNNRKLKTVQMSIHTKMDKEIKKCVHKMVYNTISTNKLLFYARM